MSAENEEQYKVDAKGIGSWPTSIQGPSDELNAEKECGSPPLNEKKQLTSKETKDAYFASLNEWLKQAYVSQTAMAMFPWYLVSSYPQLFQNQTNISFPPANLNTQIPSTNMNTGAANNNRRMPAAGVVPGLPAGFRILDDHQQAEIINRTGGYEYVIAPFWKRVAAELIDMIILLVLKVMVTFTVMNLFDLDLGFDLDKEILRKAMDEEDFAGLFAVSLDFLAFSSDLLMLEILTKIIVCFYEAIWTTAHNGATPGKTVMNLRIQYAEAVLPLQQAQMQQQFPPRPFQAQRMPVSALVFPAEVPTFQRAFMRAVVKNLIMTLFFPMCFIMIFFKNNRTAYDLITKTIVVENNPNPVLRRPQ